MSYRNCREGDVVFVRATVVHACPELFQVRIEDHPSLTVTTWLPASEIAKAEDIAALRPMRRASRR
jgi:hypothetical protein